MAIYNYNIHVTDPTVVPVVTTSDMKYHQERNLTHLRQLFFLFLVLVLTEIFIRIRIYQFY